MGLAYPFQGDLSARIRAVDTCLILAPLSFFGLGFLEPRVFTKSPQVDLAGQFFEQGREVPHLQTAENVPLSGRQGNHHARVDLGQMQAHVVPRDLGLYLGPWTARNAAWISETALYATKARQKPNNAALG